jgi:hypothetical protein
MVDISDFIDPDGEGGDDGDGKDLEALKGCLQALADAIASTNLAVLSGTQGDAGGATARVQASVGALKRFHDNFVVLKGEAEDEEADEDD